MLAKNLIRLPSTYEYAVLWDGQSNATPNGSQQNALPREPQLNPKTPGLDVNVTIATGSGTETLPVTTAFAGEYVGARLYLGRPDAPAVGYGIIRGNTVVAGFTTALTVEWKRNTVLSGAQDGYIVFTDGRHRQYEHIRILTPYLPDQGGAYPSTWYSSRPGVAASAGITSYEDLGLFLPLTFFEGIVGYGISTDDATANAATAATANDFDTTGLTAGQFAGGMLWVEHGNGVSMLEIGNNSTTQLVAEAGAAWTGAGVPAGTPGDWRWMVWLPHYLDNPNAWTLGPGFLYPNNESQPRGAVFSRPRGNVAFGWGTRWGAMVSWAHRLSVALGKRINVIPLAIDASSLIPNYTLTGGAPEGWLSTATRLGWNPETDTGLAARFANLITNVAPKALLAEGNTKPLRILSESCLRGEAETVSESARALWPTALSVYHGWLRKLVFDAGLSYYSRVESLPVVNARVSREPWETLSDTGGVVNAGHDDFAAKVPFARNYNTDNSPRLVSDPIHFDAVGEVLNGTAAADLSVRLIEEALELELDVTYPELVEICNLALGHIGDAAQITSLDLTVDQSTQAKFCRRFFKQARDTVLQKFAWSFATTRGALEPVTNTRTAEWACAYGLPSNSLRFFAVLPDNAGDDYSININSGSIVRDSAGVTRSLEQATGYTPQKFRLERDDDGYMVIRTNVENAIGRWTHIVNDPRQWSPNFWIALSYQLASMLAGPMVQDDKGKMVAREMLVLMQPYLGDAKVQDVLQTDDKPEQVASWIAARRGSRGR